MKRNQADCLIQNHDQKNIQYICIDTNCQLKLKGLCEICKYSDHFNHQTIHVDQLDSLIEKGISQEIQYNNQIRSSIIQQTSVTISLLEKKIKQIQADLQNIKSQHQKQESFFQLLHEQFIKNNQLNQEEYCNIAELLSDNIIQEFGKFEWKQDIYVNQYQQLQIYSKSILYEAIAFTQNIDDVKKLKITINENQIIKLKQLLHYFHNQFESIMNEKSITIQKKQINSFDIKCPDCIFKFSSIDLSNDEQYLAGAGSDKYYVIVFMAKTAEVYQELKISTQQVYSLKFSTNDEYLIASGSKPYEIYCWNTKNWIVQPIIFQGHTSFVYRVLFSNDSKYLLSCSADKTAILWNLETKFKQQQYLGHQQNIYGCSISQQFDRVATISGDGTIIIYNRETADIICKFIAHESEFGGAFVNFIINDNYIISSGSDGKIKLWKGNSYELEREFIGHKSNWIWSISLTKDLEYFATISNDQTIKLWDFKSGKILLSIQNENNGSPGSEVVLKNKQFLIATSTSSIKIWKLN